MDCIFCKIAAKEIPSSVVYEDELVFAFNDIHPQAPVHILVIPKTHAENLLAMGDLKILEKTFEVIRKIAKKLDLGNNGYRVVLNQGRDAGQAVPHIHFHILAGRSLGWPPG